MMEEDLVHQLKQMVIARGQELYGGEAVTQEQHALQCAFLAESEKAPPSLIVAALLHDVGHLLDDAFINEAAPEDDHHHEVLGDMFLSRWFGPDVTEPARLHVAAKRYLCAVDPAYLDGLSPASRHSLALQGGVMSPAEAAAFIAAPFAEDAVRLRLWDDRAKELDLVTPDLDHFLAYAQPLARLQP